MGGEGEAAVVRVEGEGRGERLVQEDAARLPAAVQLRPAVEHLAGGEMDQLRVLVEADGVLRADRHQGAGRLRERDQRAEAARGEVVDGEAAGGEARLLDRLALPEVVRVRVA